MSLVYSKFHKMMVDMDAAPALIERNRRVEYIMNLRHEKRINVHIDHKKNETVATIVDDGIELRAAISDFPTDAIYSQLLLVFG
jgi:hypothetical protein